MVDVGGSMKPSVDFGRMPGDGELTCRISGGGGPKLKGKERRAEAKERKKSRKERTAEEEEEEEGKSGGIRWMPLMFCVLMTGPGWLPIAEGVVGFVSETPLGTRAWESCVGVGLCDSYRTKITNYYLRYNPDKLKDRGFVSRLLAKAKGKEAKLFRSLEKKAQHYKMVNQHKAQNMKDEQDKKRYSEYN